MEDKSYNERNNEGDVKRRNNVGLVKCERIGQLIKYWRNGLVKKLRVFL